MSCCIEPQGMMLVEIRLYNVRTLLGLEVRTQQHSIYHTHTHVCIMYVLQVNKKFCELKGGNIGIVEKAQETRFGMSPEYSKYIGIAS